MAMKRCKHVLAFQSLCILLYLQICEAKTYNVLMILIDDLRTETGTYTSNLGEPAGVSFTPNLDAFANESLQFQNAYVQVPLCGPSRASIFTGRTPESLNYYFHNLGDVKDEKIIDLSPIETLPVYLKNNGFATRGAGKVFHKALNLESEFQDSEITSTDQCDCKGDSCPVFKCSVDDDSSLTDYDVLKYGLKQIGDFKKSGNKFFMALGIRKPHLPYRVPSRHTDNIASGYPNGVAIATSNERASKDSLSNYYCASIDRFANAHTTGSSTQLNSPIFSDELQRDFRSGYYAAVSWADELVGGIIAKLKEEELYDETVILVVSDNGWQLGEHGNWCKNSATDLSTRVPMWIRHPEGRFGQREQQIVSLVGLYPTLIELAGLSIPNRISSNLHGESYAELVTNRSSQDSSLPLNSKYSSYAFSVIARCFNYNTMLLITCKESDQINVLGYTVRSNDWRYTEWRTYDVSVKYGNGFVLEKELYDHKLDDGTDLDSSEIDNVVELEEHSQVVSLLSQVLAAHFGCPDSSCDPDSITFSPTNSPTDSPTEELTKETPQPTTGTIPPEDTDVPTTKPTSFPSTGPPSIRSNFQANNGPSGAATGITIGVVAVTLIAVVALVVKLRGDSSIIEKTTV